MFRLIAFACVLGIAAAAPYGGLEVAAVDSVSIPRYEFNYAVNDPATGDNKAQKEIRDGDVVKGSYSLTEPDGTLRVVEYSADSARGFNAIVKRVGAAAHPQTLIAPVISKQIVAPIVEPVIAQPIIAPIRTPLLNEIALTGDLGLGGWGKGIGVGLEGLGLGSWNLGGLRGWKH